MKAIKFFSVAVFALLLTVSSFAQQKEMTMEEWQNEMNSLNQKKNTLMTESQKLNSDITNLKNMMSSMNTYEDCMNQLYSSLGGTKTDVDGFRKAVNELERQIRDKKAPKADRQKDLDALKANKLSALPEFFDKVHNQLQRMLDNWSEVAPEVVHNVVKGDCLWCIARQKQYYGNGFAWPKIYEANRSVIGKNPNLIYPNQKFTIPALTDSEKEMYDKKMKNYKPAPTN